MKLSHFLLSVLSVSSALLFSNSADAVQLTAEQIVVANRGSGSISVIDSASDLVTRTVSLPFVVGEMMPEPMYVVYIPSTNEVVVGDRANNRVVFFDSSNYSVTNTVQTGAGVFHMWADPDDEQLWVNNDIDNTITVIDPVTKQVLATVPVPADLNVAGGAVHDVILDPSGDFAYVSISNVGGASDPDAIVKFSTSTFLEVDRADVGEDPHVSLTDANNFLYVPAQDSNRVEVLDRGTLDLVTTIGVPGAHGAGFSPDGKTFYTTNLPGGGNNGLFAIDTENNVLIGNPVDTPFSVPHNIVLAALGNKLYLTHSGPNDRVSVYSIENQLPVLQGDVTVGQNPFGLTRVFSVTSVPESSSVLGVVALGAIGASSLLNRKQNK